MQKNRLRLAVVLFALNCIDVLAAEAPLEFDQSGGDVWTFQKHVSGRVNAAGCDDVYVEGPAGTTAAVIDGKRFSARVPLRGGTNELRALCKLNDAEVASSNPQRWVTRIEDKPRAWVRVRVDGQAISMDAGRSELAPGVAAPIRQYEWHARAGNPAPLTLAPDGGSLAAAPVVGKNISIATPTADGEYYVNLRVIDSLGRSDQSTGVFEVVDGAPREIDLELHRPAWVDRAVLYGVAPFAFGKGGYDDVRKRLPSIAALGVTAIWLSPITAAPAEDFGYAVTDHFRSREEFGSEQQLRALIDAAHRLGLRVIMDFVPNHFSSAHRYYADAERNQRRSAYFEWFERSDSGEAMHYFDWDNLKNLEYDHEEVQNYMLEAFSYWVREFEIDGFRVDVSWGVRERAPEFWPRWRAELKRIDPDLLLIAEASALDPFYVANGFDVAYDWTSKLGEWAWQDVFAGKNSRPDLQRLRAALAKSTVDLPGRGLVLRFLNNNDTGVRFVTRHGVEQTRVAAAMLFTLPGLPLVYNGDEVGAEFQPYEEQPISWRDRNGLLPYYTRLIELRRDVAALSTPHIELLNTTQDESVLAYVRKLDSPSPGNTAVNPNPADVLVVLNFTKDAVDVQLPSVAAVDALFAGGSLKDLLTGERIPAVTSMSLRLEPFQARVLSRSIDP